MSYLNNFVYEEAKPLFDCQEGENAMCIKSVTEATTQQGVRMLVIACNVKNSNGEQFKHFLVEGQYFDKALSRFMDCFGIQATELNPQSWVNRIGKAKFNHWKYDSQLKKNVQVAEIQCHLLKKEGFSQPAITPATPATPAEGPFPEDIPF